MRKITIFCAVVFVAAHGHALILKESIDLALKNNPAVISAQKKVEAANARLSQAMGAFLPTIKLDGSYGKSYTQPSTVQFTTTTPTGSATQTLTFGNDATETSRSYAFSLSQPLFVGGLFPGLKIAQKSADLAKEDLRRSSQETAFNVAQAYFGVLRAQKSVGFAAESMAMAQAHLDLVRKMAAAGVATRADVLRGEVQLANSEVTLTRASNALEIARDAFNNALGRKLESKVEIKEEEFDAAVSTPPNLLETALANRPDWRQYLLTKEIGEENVRVAQTAYLPTVMLTGQAGNRSVEYPTYKSDVNSWSIVGAASWTLFDGLGTQNRIREALANLEAQRSTEEQVRNGIELEVRDAYFILKSGLETIGSAKKAMASAEESNRVSTARFERGVGTNVEVLDAQVSLTLARLNYLQALYDVEIAKARINKVVGKEVL